MADVALVGVKFAEQLVGQCFDHILVAVVHIGAGQDEVKYLATLVAHQVQLEPHVLPHRALTLDGQPGEHPHRALPLVVDDGDARAVDERDARALAEAAQLQKHHQRDEAARLQLHETVVGERSGEQVAPMPEHALAVVMLEVAETVVVECHHDGDYLRLAHSARPVAALFAVGRWQNRMFFNLSVKFFAKIIGNTKNLCNFVLCNHSE